MDNQAVIKWGWLRAILGLPILFVVVRATGGLPDFVMRSLDIQLHSMLQSRLISVTNNLIFLTLTIYLLRRFIDRRSFISLGFAVKGIAKDVILGLGAAFLIMSAAFGILFLLGCIEIASFNVDYSVLAGFGIYLLLAAALEELPMRGYMLSNMLDSMNKYVAVGIISVIFGLIHATGQIVSVIGIINCTLLGLIVGLYYIRTRNLSVPIVFHAGWNFFQGIIYGFKVSGASFEYSLFRINLTGSDWLTGGNYGLEGSLILTCLTVPAIILYEVLSQKQEARTAKTSAWVRLAIGRIGARWGGRAMASCK